MKKNSIKVVNVFDSVFYILNLSCNLLTGINTGLYATHPITGASIPIYVASYVVSDYGTGAIMGVPAHDQRDWNFTKANRVTDEKDIKRVVKPDGIVYQYEFLHKKLSTSIYFFVSFCVT